jgi:hypothetical protein
VVLRVRIGGKELSNHAWYIIYSFNFCLVIFSVNCRNDGTLLNGLILFIYRNFINPFKVNAHDSLAGNQAQTQTFLLIFSSYE